MSLPQGSNCGKKMAEVMLTEYRYDKLGRQIATIFPDEDDDLAWDPRSGSSSARANNPQES